MSIVNDLNKINNIKHEIKNAIINKGVEMADNTPFADYPNKIDSIPDNYDNGYSNGYSDGYEEGSANGGGGNPFYEDFYNIKTNNGTNFANLFDEYPGNTLDISSFDTSNVTNMYAMFRNCTRLTSLDLSNFDTSNVENMESMFNNCYRLTSLDLSNFDTSKVIYMLNMLYNCSNLQELRLDNCSNDTINKIITSNGFPTGTIDGQVRTIYCKEENVAGLKLPYGWKLVNAVTGEVIVIKEPEFYEPGYYKENSGIEEATTMVTSEHDNLEYMFAWCINLRTINNISKWDTSNVRRMNQMFEGCESLASLDLSNFITKNVDNMESMFNNCKSLTELDLSNFDTSNVENMEFMFSRCNNLTELNLSNFELRYRNPDMMFSECRKLHTLHLDNCNEDTIRKIIESFEFPTGEAEGHEGTRQIFVNPDNIGELTAPDGWEFSFID